MPNYVKNEVEFYGDINKINQLRNKMRTKDQEFDFNQIIKMPEDLNVTAGSDEDISMACATAKRMGASTCKEYESRTWAKNAKTFNQWAQIGEKYLRNKEKYGYTTWYDWCCANWGTKWNACDAYWSDFDFVTFETAWGTPEPIFRELARQYPDIEFYARFADEDLGNNCGYIEYKDGQFRIEYTDDLELACELWGEDPSSFTETFDDGYPSLLG